MADFILLMHGDGADAQPPAAWEAYLSGLSAQGVLRGGSAIGGGEALRRTGAPAPLTTAIVGYVKVEARDLAHARSLLAGNPVFEAGGTVEVRELPRAG